MKQLAVVLSPGNKLKFELFPNCVLFFKLELQTYSRGTFMNFLAVAIVYAIVLGHSFNKRVDI